MCVYQCINGQGVPISEDCPIIPCPQSGGPCDSEGNVYTKPCPRPFAKSKEEVQDNSPHHTEG
jgi:hypothetical protein